MNARIAVLVLAAALGLTGCLCSDPFRQCDAPAPTCYLSCRNGLEAPGCYGEPYDATCIREGDDLDWWCRGGTEASACSAMVDVCRPIPYDSGVRDSGILPPFDGGP